ncbi:hypothetical protein BSF44_53940 [Pseudomonas sp. ACN8]|nr:hypothetical protein BSF44_53940 [Pseudomonas sp. ACN8]
MPPLVGASSLAMDVNDNACCLDEHIALRSIASKLAPTMERSRHKCLLCDFE